MKPPRKSRNFSQPKMRRTALPGDWQKEILQDWLNYLLDTRFSMTLRSSDTNTRLRGVRQETARLKSMDGCFGDEKGFSNIAKAVASLEEEERHLLYERTIRTYECQYFGRTASREFGNVEGAERFSISIFIIRNLRPMENPYDVLRKDLASRKFFVSSKAIQMRVRRLGGKVGAGEHMAWHQILQHQYQCYKYFVGMNLWFSRFQRLPPSGYLRKCLTLTGAETKMLRRLVAGTKY
jgi:hypothetical protein